MGMRAVYDPAFDVWRVQYGDSFIDIRGVYSWATLDELRAHLKGCKLNVFPKGLIDLDDDESEE